ncbi:MAG TPA: COX aromatic rich motif-containing protein [Candidatus Saccharimonadales bacterium]
MKRGLGIVIGVLVAAGLTLLAWWLVHDKQFDVLNPGGEIAIQQRNLLIFTLSLSGLIVIPVYVMLGGFAWRYREGNKKAKYQPNFTKSTALEALWWGIPIAIIGVLSVVTFQTSHSLDPYRRIASDKDPIKVQVVALQWKWLFIYPDKGVATVNYLAVPQKVPVEFSLTADAPMSGFWVPALGSQIYAMNGMDSKLNLVASNEGTFRGYSTNINGEGYARMKLLVKSMPEDKFNSWLDQAQKSDNMLDENEYKELAKASQMSEERTYMLHEPKLFDVIMMKYMHGGHASSQPVKQDEASESDSKDGHSMMNSMNHMEHHHE